MKVSTRLGRMIIFLVLMVAVCAFLAAHILAWRWATEPFPGLLLESTLVLSPLQGGGWARLQFEPPLEQPDRLIALDAQPVERYADVKAILSERSVGDTVWVSVERPNGYLREEQITLTQFPLKDLFLIFVIPYLAGMAYLSIGIWVYWVRGWGRAGQAFTGMCVSIALIISTIFDLSTTHRLIVLWCAAVPFAAATAMHLALVFPQEPRFVRRIPVLRLLPYLPATFLALRSIFSVYDVGQPWSYIAHWRHSYLFAVAGILFLLGMLIYRLIKPPSPLVRQQSRIILLGAALAFLPVVPWLLINALGHPVPFLAWLYAPLFIFFPLSIAYAIVRYRLLDVDRFLSRSLAYGGLTFLIVGFYFAFTSSLNHFFTLGADDPLLLSFFVLVLVLLFNPLRNWVQQIVDRAFFRGTVDYQMMLRDFSHESMQILDLDAVLTKIGQQIERSLRPVHQWIYLYDEEEACYNGRAIGRAQKPVSMTTFAPEGALALWLREHQECLYLPAEQELASEMGDAWEQMDALGAVLYAPLRAQDRLSGWLALGPKRSDRPYSSDDVAFLSALADQSALAVKNAHLFANLRRSLAAVTERKNLMEDILSSVLSGVITVDNQGCVTFLNGAAESLLDVRADEMIGSSYRQVIPSLKEDLPSVLEAVKREEVPLMTYEVQLEPSSRGPAWLRVNLSPLKDSRDKVTGVVVLLDGLAERR